MYRLIYVIDASVRFFIRDINSFRLLIVNAAIPMAILTTYELLMNILNTYVGSLIATATPYLRSIVINAISFINSITYLIITSLTIVFIVTSIFMVNGLIRSLKDDLKAIISIFRSSLSATTYIALLMFLISIYSFALGVSVAVALVLVLMKVLTTLNLIPIANYGIDITSALPVVIPLACVACVTYIGEGIVWVRRYASLP
ncbi:hypothetical protein [Vulcanisaeta souniana]|uniref:Uncharacterized protein n=2 Tax=Vulcanisaeta souniana JCM 11219 TaxID=1293586 RepID=A0ABM8BNZ5_9CREN|nr:hypothetical protein [Vulcanisaeta souniana]BDR92735.1 hypothetical protein Vsou_18280 [Vulcanisaeta souniana JCM 11219]